MNRSTDGIEARQVIAQWLYSFFFEDWTLKLMALVITLGLWYAVTGQRTPATVRLRSVPLEFVRPPNVEISNEPVDEVDVTLEGSQGKLAELNARNLVARADITDLKPGDRVVLLGGQNVNMDLPDGVRIVNIEPRNVGLRLEPVVEREVDVEARFEGNLPEGFVRTDVQISQPRIRVRGPESHVEAIEKAYTETISLEGQTESLVLPQIAVDIPDRKVVPLDPVISMRVVIEEMRADRRFTDVTVLSPSGGEPQPASATVTVRGPRSWVAKLQPGEVRILLEQQPDGSVLPRLSLPPQFAARIELVSVAPSSFSIRR